MSRLRDITSAQYSTCFLDLRFQRITRFSVNSSSVHLGFTLARSRRYLAYYITNSGGRVYSSQRHDLLYKGREPSTDLDGNDECKSDCVDDLVKIENVTYDDVVLAISELKSSLTVGVDNILSFIIKGCSEFLIYPLLVLSNLPLRTKVFPGAWKQTKIIPVFKKGDAQNCKNYRPIAILSPFSKIFESIIHKKLYNQVKNLISTSQHGLIPKRSTTINLFCLTDKIISSFESGSQLDVIYTDFSKAFDSIDFGILLKKLQGIGFHVNLIAWILSYLCKRSLYVYFNNAVSHEFTSTSGVPQGSNLGPLLFMLFINDLTCVLKYSGCFLFADDLKLFGSIRSDLDSVLLQRDLDCLFKWCIDNRLHLNTEKCSVLSYTRKAQPLIHVYKINNLVLSRSNTITDLGIIFDSKLDFPNISIPWSLRHIAGLDFLSVEPENFPVNLPSRSCIELIFVPIWNTAVLSGIPITETK
ncbi:putative RNA-directed DNA polymerase from transposon BS [Araneus ventricosus]|uniref:Putative RNA-directed DNA polymerase from transposon BS n=1 Tax=Araneus ventricosus TaxID=182803 RepID=A0A4Y2JMB1_ARAVE|nr:putative RNA-directed DNA polymerase from transposon BS [Araneus ventricosus]